MNKRIVIIGGGPGGYVAAIRAAQLGATVSLVEQDKLGGTCLNRGCIPTKAMLHSAELFRAIQKSSEWGIQVEGVQLDWPAVLRHKQGIVGRLVTGIGGLLKANSITTYQGKARLLDAGTVAVLAGGQEQRLQADGIVIAVGSEPAGLPIPGAGLPGVVDSTQALELKQIPKSLLIIGGGVIGLEFAALYGALGSTVTVVELQDQVLPGLDREVAAVLQQEMAGQGVAFYTKTRVQRIEVGAAGLVVETQTESQVRSFAAEVVLVAVGRKPSLDGIGLEAAGVRTSRNGIFTDDHFQTNIPGIYAIGDCNGKTMLAHAASAQGVAAVEALLGHRTEYWGHIVPACIYTQPELASVGMSEEQAAKAGLAYQVGRFSLAGNGKALIENGGKGLIKIIVGARHQEILGVHLLGPRATDLIAEAALAIRLEATVTELVSTIHAHPTVGEAVAEAALDVNGLAVHWPPRAR